MINHMTSYLSPQFKYQISSNDSCPSNNPRPPLSTFSLPFIRDLCCDKSGRRSWNGVCSNKSNQWWFRLDAEDIDVENCLYSGYHLPWDKWSSPSNNRPRQLFEDIRYMIFHIFIFINKRLYCIHFYANSSYAWDSRVNQVGQNKVLGCKS